MYRSQYRGRGRGNNHGGGNRSTRGGARQQRRDEQPMKKPPRPLGYHELRRILHTTNASDKLCEVMRVKDDIICLLNSDSIRETGILTTFIEILSSVCTTKTMSQNLYLFLNNVRATLFWRQNLSLFLAKMRTEDSVEETDKYPALIKDIICVFQEMLDRLDCIDFPLDDLEQTVNRLKAKHVIDDEKIVESLTRLREARQEKVESLAGSTDNKPDDNLPPNDFRQIPIFPTPKTLMDEEYGFLRKNKVHEGYSNVEEYLDIQFRLLHQDFLLPLRDAIKHLAGNTELQSRRGRQRNIKHAHVYENVNILYPVGTESGIVYRLYLGDAKKFKRMKWETNRRLLHRSLVCLSGDGFNREFILGTVYQRDPEGLASGLIDILLEGETKEGLARTIDSSKPLQMIETAAYFESYRHVLKRLQDLSPTEMPFKEYFINPERDMAIKMPQFLDGNNGDGTAFDIKSLFSEASDTEEKPIDLADDSQWPSPADIGCDDSQSEAIKHALKSELALIQGPPGTGKTYIGLRVMETLLQNRHIWTSDDGDPSPVLVMCYTNHALDQFLEGILKFLDDDIIRIGGRCKSDRVQRFRLKNVRQRIRLNAEVPHNIHGARSKIMQDLNKLAREIEETGLLLFLPQAYIMHENTLKDFMDDNHFRSLLTNWLPEGQGSVLFQWLAVGRAGLVQGNTVNTSDLKDTKGRFGGMHDLPEFSEPFSDTESIPSTSDDDSNQFGEIIDAEDEEFMKEALVIDEDEPLDIVQDSDDKAKTHVTLSLAEARKNALPKRTVSNIQNYSPNARQNTRSQRQPPKTIEHELYGTDYMKKSDADNIQDVWGIRSETQKWRLYRYWVNNFTDHYMSKKVSLDKEYRDVYKRYEEILAQEDRVILQQAKVIGMTTTGASKYHSLLQEVKPKIVVVEEAAEIFEAHIVAALTNECKHLILVGDHQQLRPTPTVHKLAKDYNLDVSLFERLIRMRFPFKRLSHQHRMRPNIAKYMRHIYPDLQDAEVVTSYEDIQGMKNNVFFVAHTKPEDVTDKDSTTHANSHEAKFLVELCRYLLRQGYQKHQITILTAYSGQLHLIQENMPKEDFEGVRIATIDNFQGEENDIILLSLVRSNEDEQIGFLKVENRICVALSRAKQGLYCIGNFDNLTLNSKLWSSIIGDAKKDKLVGTGLPLVCQCHSNNVTYVSSSTDFDKVPLGGCGRPCEAKLSCGHDCPRPCHPLDREHTAVKCKQDCTNIVCERGHKCPYKCGEPCVTKCAVKIEKVMPECEHKQAVECGTDVTTLACTYPCLITLPCTHEHRVACGDRDSLEIECKELVPDELDCGHVENRPCCIPKNVFPCPHPCSAVLPCGHTCQGSCSICIVGHLPCQDECGKQLYCSHVCRGQCNESCKPCSMTCEQRCLYHRWFCNKPCDRPCVPCNRPCIWQCPHSRCTRKCGEICNRQPCSHPCKFQFPNCKHFCMGLCGESCICPCTVREDQPEIKIDCQNPRHRFVRLDDCGHVFEVKDIDAYILSMSSTGRKMHLLQHIPCPQRGCGTPIRNCRRYGAVIKQIMLSLNFVKRKMYTLSQDIWRAHDALDHEIGDFQQDLKCRQGNADVLAHLHVEDVQRLKQSLYRERTPEGTVQIRNLFTLFKYVEVLTRAFGDRASFVHSEIAENALRTVPRRLKAATEKIQQERVSRDEMNDVLEECHQIRLLLELEAVDDKLCRKARETIMTKDSTLSEEQAKRICCDDDEVKEIRPKLKDCVWLLENAIACREQQKKVQDSVDRLSEEFFGYSEDIIPGRNTKLKEASGEISGRWWICSEGHTLAESVFLGHESEDKLCPMCATREIQATA